MSTRVFELLPISHCMYCISYLSEGSKTGDLFILGTLFLGFWIMMVSGNGVIVDTYTGYTGSLQKDNISIWIYNRFIKITVIFSWLSFCIWCQEEPLLSLRWTTLTVINYRSGITVTKLNNMHSVDWHSAVFLCKWIKMYWLQLWLYYTH